MYKIIPNLVVWSTLFIRSFVPIQSFDTTHTHIHIYTTISGTNIWIPIFYTERFIVIPLRRNCCLSSDESTFLFSIVGVVVFLLFYFLFFFFFLLHNNAFMEVFPQPFFANFYPHSYINSNWNIPTQQIPLQPILLCPHTHTHPPPSRLCIFCFTSASFITCLAFLCCTLILTHLLPLLVACNAIIVVVAAIVAVNVSVIVSEGYA